jgi:alpha-tubulin suppressor-like RCC1 family protein
MGKGNSGQLGTGTIENNYKLEPVTHPLKGVPVSDVSCGWQHTLCISQGILYAWGHNGSGQLGLGDFFDRCWPVQVSSISDITSISAGYCHSGAITAEGKVYLWGSNPDGRLFKKPLQLKHQVYKKENIPAPIDIIGKNIVCSVTHTLILSQFGEVYSAGSTEHGQLGMGVNYETHTFLYKIPCFSDGSAVKIGCGDRYSAVLNNKNQLFTFGKGGFGRLGNGKHKDNLEPTMIKDLCFSQFACGGRHMLALDLEKNLFAWGYGYYYQLGTLNQEDYLEPVKIDTSNATDREKIKISCGYFHSAILTS